MNVKYCLIACLMQCFFNAWIFASADEKTLPKPYDEIFAKLVEEAESGDMEAMHDLGLAYSDRQGYVYNYNRAIDCLTKAATSGIRESQFALARLYYIDGIYSESFFWFSKAAMQKHPEALLFLGISYELGRGVPENHHMGKLYIKEAAEEDNDLAVSIYGSYSQDSDEDNSWETVCNEEKDLTNGSKSYWSLFKESLNAIKLSRLSHIYGYRNRCEK